VSVSDVLAQDRLGIPSVLFYNMAGVAPLTVAAGVLTTAFAVTGLTGLPAAFPVIAVVLVIFSVGYVAMARHIKNAGAFYAFISQGLGRVTGVGAAIVALVAYTFLQVGLYGAFGPTMADAMAHNRLHLNVAWYWWSLGAWLLVAVLGWARIDLASWILAVLLVLEVAVIVVLGVVGLRHPAGGHMSFATLSPTELLKGGVGVLIILGVLGNVGFEQGAVLSEEARHPRKTIPYATYISVAGIAGVYTLAAFAMVAANGDKVVDNAREMGPGLFFSLAGDSRFLGGAANTLFLTSVFAAMLSFHNTVARYSFALGREGVLFRALGRTGRNSAPRVASAAQSAIGLVVIALYAVMGWDPLTKLFFWLGTTGGFGVLVLLFVTSVAVVVFFARNRHRFDENLWRRAIAPGISFVLLGIMLWLTINSYSTLLGVPGGSVTAKLLPAAFVLAAIVGVLWGLVLRATSPAVYAKIGLGPEAAVAGGTELPVAGARLAERGVL
jgi:amino acid transporter